MLMMQMLEARLMASLNMGTYTTVGQFTGTGVTLAGPSLDADFNGVGDGVSVLTNTLQEFTFSIADGGTMLSIHVEAFGLDGSAAYVFDSIVVSGDAVPEPQSALLLAFGCISLALSRRR